MSIRGNVLLLSLLVGSLISISLQQDAVCYTQNYEFGKY